MMEREAGRLRGLARLLVDALRERLPEIVLNSDLERGLPGLVSVSIPDAAGYTLAAEMDLRGYAVSSGSACHSGDVEPSRIILAMGRPRRVALGTVRISMGRHTRPETVREFASVFAEVVERQRNLA
jgi:cysteine desulfurase